MPISACVSEKYGSKPTANSSHPNAEKVIRLSASEALGTTLLQTLILMVLYGIPCLFAIQSMINEEKAKAAQEISEWMTSNAGYLYHESGVIPPKSVRFRVGVFDASGKALYSNLSSEPEELFVPEQAAYPWFFYQTQTFMKNGDVRNIIIQIPINYNRIFFVSALLFFIVFILMLVLNRYFHSYSIQAYQRMNETLNDFFNDAMHELKTPLGVIHINLELIANTQLTTKQFRRIKAAAKQMQMTYEDLEYHIKHNHSMYHKEKLYLSEYIGLRLSFFEDLAVTKQINIEPFIEEDVLVYMNKVEMQRIIDNTISNAIKYSPRGTRIRVGLKKTEKSCCVLSVEDQGRGIKDVSEIFYRFKREDDIQGGFGLGLSIVKKICDQNDIQIDVKSELKEGSTFSYTIPLYTKRFLDDLEDSEMKDVNDQA